MSLKTRAIASVDMKMKMFKTFNPVRCVAFIIAVAVPQWAYGSEPNGGEGLPKLMSLRDTGHNPLCVDVEVNPLRCRCLDRQFSTPTTLIEFLSQQPDALLADGLLLVSHTKSDDDADAVAQLFAFAKRRELDVFVQPALSKIPATTQRTKGPFVYWYPAEHTSEKASNWRGNDDTASSDIEIGAVRQIRPVALFPNCYCRMSLKRENGANRKAWQAEKSPWRLRRCGKTELSPIRRYSLASL
jgi:hypothetical protein